MMTHTNNNTEGGMENSDHTWEHSFDKLRDQRCERNLRELASDLADLVRSGDLTDAEANEWYDRKADQWMAGSWR